MAPFSFLPVIALALLASRAAAQTVPVFGQCGGLTYSGPTTCVAGTFCNWDSDFFSQCIPGTAPPPPAGPINFWFPFGDSYTSTSFNTTSVLPNIHNPLGNPPFPGFTGAGGENYVGFDTVTFNKTLLFSYVYAFGGATINATLVAPFEPTVLSLGDQVNEFLAGVASKPATTPWTSANALFSVWIDFDSKRAGVNDMAGSYFEAGDRGAFANTLLDQYFGLMQKLVRCAPHLYDLCHSPACFPHSSTHMLVPWGPHHSNHRCSNVGARNFLFLNVPTVDLTPLIIAEGASAQALLKSVIADFNTRLASRVASFKASNAGVATWLWDSNTVFATILKSPTQFEFVDAVSFGDTGDFWGNNFHPSAAAHQIFAKDISTLMAGTTWF
ncbi:hypothetical protein B0H19DRAFT_1270449 [Mycena capillaripes]|nr:hypothetical protein B0H19DRAFT_1270449 [Mycena capillaripes]